MSKSTFIIVLLSSALTLTALAYWPQRHAGAANDAPTKNPIANGAAVKVYFRSDAAGQTSQSYVAGIANQANLAGTLVGMDDTWITIADKNKQYTIARSAVMLLETSK